ncbi:MAG: ABC transporter permease [Candidatus Helarchaeota archaeon]|nr:ABC transporter permease [Candidatus Helarchaeota archaeon]
MTKGKLHQINLIPRKRSIYAVVGLLLSSILFATCATVFIGVYSYISTYLGDSDETLILTQSGTGNFIATRYISMQVAESAEYIQGVTLVSPETLTPCLIKEKTCFVRGIISNKFYTMEDLTLDSGRFLTNDDIYGAFVGSRAAKRLQISTGDSFIIYSGLRDTNLQVTAIGIFSSGDVALNDEVLIPLYAGQILSGNYPNRITYIRVKYNESLISRNVLEEHLIFQHDLTVQVLSNETDSPIESGRVEIYDIKGNYLKSGFTDSLGEIAFSLDFGNYTIIVTYDEVQVNSSIFLDTDQEISLKIANPPISYTLNVELLDENQIGIPHTTIIAWKGSEIIQMRQTNSFGETNFSLPSDIYQFSTLIWNNFTQELVEFRQTANPTQNESLIFWYRRYKLGVRVSDPYSGEFFNATVAIRFMNGTVIKSGETGDLGYGEFKDLTPTTYNISIDFGEIQQHQIIELRSDRTLNFEILPQFDLEIHVFNDSNELPINNSYIKLYDSSNNLFENYTDENGIANFSIQLDIYNITVESGGFIKNRIIYLNSSRNETFWMPNYNLTIVVKNITGNLQDNINVSLISASLNDSQLSQNGHVTFFVPPDSYNITLNCSNVIISQIYEILDPLEAISFIIPPYNLSVYVYNGSDIDTLPLSNINISIFENRTLAFLTSSVTVAGVTNFLLNPGYYNISANISNVFYYQTINFDQPYANLTFYSFPYNLTIIILNGSTATPQPGLEVQLYDLNNSLMFGPNISDSEGRVTFFVDPMTYNVTINNSAYLISKLKSIEGPNIISIFEFPPYNLTIRVFNASDNSPIQNALVEILLFEDNSTNISKTTSIEGIVQFDLSPGKYYINLTYGNYNIIQFKEILADPQIDYHIPPYKLTIQVIDYGGSPLKDANVTINGGDPSITNDSGYIHFYLQPNIYNITASWENYTEFEVIDIKTYQESFLVVLRLSNKVSLNVSVVNAINGQFFTNASIRIFEFLGDLVDSKLTDQDGFSQFFLAPQVYNLSVVIEGSQEYQLINLTSDEEVIFSIIPSYKLTIFAFDDSVTHFAKDVVVQIYELSGYLLFQDITNDYGECLFNLEYGTYNISLSKGSEQKSEVMDISQNEFLSFHMAPYKIIVNAINSTTLTPLSNALVTIYTLGGVEVTSDETNGLGIAEFLVDPGQYYIYLKISDTSWIREVDLRQSNTSMQIVFSVSIGISSKIDVGDPLEYSASLLQQTLGLTESVVYILAIILTILVSFSIMNVVSSCVSESRRHIGTIRSIGASNQQIYFLINYRIILISIVAGALGGGIGIMLGSLISIGALEISLTQIITVQLFFTLLFSAMGVTLLIGIISANLTLYRILKMAISTSVKEILPQTV